MYFNSFQHFIFVIAGLIMGAIPNVPKEVKVQIRREMELEKEILFEEEESDEETALVGNTNNTSNNHEKLGND